MAERPNVVQQKLRLIELMRENAWMVDKSDPKYKNSPIRGWGGLSKMSKMSNKS